MPDPFEAEPNLLAVAKVGIQVCADVTKYLSTLPHPIEIIEELISACSVTCSLLNTLDATIDRFPATTQLCPKASFIHPLCYDILAAFAQFTHKVSEARKLKVFEPNDVGLVRVPRNAWIFVMGSEAKMCQLRSRLYVEKYRVRVLIDAVTWQGLRGLRLLGRTIEQEREQEMLSKMLPLIAERLMGVWKDYMPRLETGNVEKKATIFPHVQQVQQVQQVRQAQQVQEQEKTAAMVVVRGMEDDFKNDVKLARSKLTLHSSPSTTSVASSCSTCSTSSSMTIIDDSIHERWILRRSESKRQLTTRSYIFGIPFHSTYTYTAAHHYVIPLSSHPSEIEALVTQQIATGSSIDKDILKIPDDAQREIQKLLESRENASSHDNIKRSWEVIAFQFRPRRKIAPLTVISNKWWKRGGTKGPLEWIVAIKGETVDHKARKTPIKHEDPWNPKLKQVVKPIVAAPPAPMPAPAQVRQQAIAAQFASRAAPGAHVLRHVEQRRGLSPEEAEAKMEEILKDLFKYEKGETRHDGDGAKSCAAFTAYTSGI